MEYIVVVLKYRHFAKTANYCSVIQPTLSMMIQKLEDELAIKIFNRNKQPVEPTKEGEEIIFRAKQILSEIEKLKYYTSELKEEISGELKIAIIPTLAPYLLPLFIKSFTKKFPSLSIYVKELLTDEIVSSIKTRTIDIGILASPLYDNSVTEHHLFYEEFFAYVSAEEKISKKKFILPKDINLSRLWLLEEGHCFHNQVLNLCKLKKMENNFEQLHYEAGGVETLKNLVDRNDGITILPQLAVYELSEEKKLKVREFSSPKPVREISIVTNNNFPRKKIIEALRKEVIKNLPINVSKAKIIV